MPESTVRQFTDPEAYVASLQGTQAELSVTGKGDFAAQVTRIALHGLRMSRYFESLPRILHYDHVPGRAIILFATQPGPGMVLDSQEMQPGTIVRFSERQKGFLRSTSSTHFASISLPAGETAALSGNLVDCDLGAPRQPVFHRASQTAMERLQRLHAAAGHLALTAPEIIASPEAARGLEQIIMVALADCLDPIEGHAPSAGNAHHKRIMAKLYALLEANSDRVLHVPEICAAIGVPRRTLAAACNEVLGMGPHQYTRLRQMHLARSCLLRADPMISSVTDIATACGFWELGRFAAAYRAMFGERPSDTLRRPREPVEVSGDEKKFIRPARSA